ncbi:MAG: GFA family protein [Deltaproteobacteria bacterium]|nr:GFA family protein [Deltaproteobacteria bacterium]
MDVPFCGGCACGAIRYECTAEPIMALNCHCRDCQRASGSAYASGLFVPADAVKITRGEPRYHRTTAESGNVNGRGFCVDCGSPVLAKQSAFPIYVIYASSLDDPSGHKPTMEIYTASAQPWDYMDPALPKFAKGIGS